MDQLETNFLETANSIGAKLCRDALRDGRRVNWMGDSSELIGGNWTVAHRALGPDLYNGTSGVALFLARLYQQTNEKLHRSTAEAAARHALSRLDDVFPTARTSFYTGLTGIAYGLIEIGELFDDQDFISEGLKILKTSAQEKIGEQGLDVVAGSAGAIPALLSIYRRYPKDFILKSAVAHGEHLLKTAVKDDSGWSWNTLNMAVQYNLTGFSHGTAGIAWALYELFNQTKKQKFADAAEQAVNYERHHFSSQHENWPDFRGLYDQTIPLAEPICYPVAWCHGATGIGLSRLRLYELFNDQSYRDEAEAALRTTSKIFDENNHFIKSDFSLCHGASGDAELLIYASRVLENPDYKAFAERVGRTGVAEFQKNNNPWPCGVQNGGETPGLLLGLAGIGYFYLRLHDSDLVPSVLIIR
jgi:type 2 lantibiotic biosynthesis protein LanM